MPKIHQHTKFQTFPSMRSPGNARKPQIWPISLSPSDAKGGKSTDHDHNLISSEGAQDTSTCIISDHSLHAFSGKCPETLSGRTDGQTDARLWRIWSQLPWSKLHHILASSFLSKRSRFVGWTNGPMYRWKEVISGFARTDGRTDNPKT